MSYDLRINLIHAELKHILCKSRLIETWITKTVNCESKENLMVIDKNSLHAVGMFRFPNHRCVVCTLARTNIGSDYTGVCVGIGSLGLIVNSIRQNRHL